MLRSFTSSGTPIGRIRKNTLLSEEYRDYVGEIIVEGHTDTTGQYLNNLALSQQRALAVATYCLSDEMVGLSYTDKAARTRTRSTTRTAR